MFLEWLKARIFANHARHLLTDTGSTVRFLSQIQESVKFSLILLSGDALTTHPVDGYGCPRRED